MTFLQSIILGTIEGITEYLPISSTFHLIWTSRLLGIESTDFQKAYEVIIQSGAILAVAILYIKTFLTNRSLVLKTLTSFVPTAAIGYVLYALIKGTFFESYLLQIIIFALIGFFFIYFEKTDRQLTKTLTSFSYKDAFIIGLTQVLAVFPGVSRAGAVIVGMMFLGIKRDEAAKYSFLLAVPTLLAASVLDLYKSIPILSSRPESVVLLIAGFIAAFISALVVVRWFIGYLQTNTLKGFGYYRIGLSILLLLIFGVFVS